MRKAAALSLLIGLLSFVSLAQEIPLDNWTVPPYTEASSGGMTPMTDIHPPRVFVPVQPCRVVDTRGGGPFIGFFGPPIMAAGATRSFDINSAPHCPGIPASATAYSLNFTVTQTAGPIGDIRAWPYLSPPTQITSVLNWTETNATVANATIMPAGANGTIDVQVAGSNTHLLIDINGYFAHTLGDPTNSLTLENNLPSGPTAAFVNSATAANTSAVRVLQGPGIAIASAYAGAGLRGESATNGVLGISHQIGVAGSLVNGAGAEVAFGLLGFQVNHPAPEIAGDNVGVFGQTNDNFGGHAGVLGYASANTGVTYGVRGVTGSASPGAAGVRGQDGNGSVLFGGGPAGVRGESKFGTGVIGVSRSLGVCGYKVNASGEQESFGCLGTFSGSTVGMSVTGDSETTGSQSMIEPHPTDASKVIRYTSLEGNEAGTYFRGRGRFQNGIAVIEVPEDFRIVTDPDGLSIQVTPIGEMATVAVQSIGLDRIVVRGSRNVEFFYTVNGIRNAHKSYKPVVENEMRFVPMSPDDRMAGALPDAIKQRLISNGTYTADGKVNIETARRLGWDKVWEQRSRPAPQPAEP